VESKLHTASHPAGIWRSWASERRTMCPRSTKSARSSFCGQLSSPRFLISCCSTTPGQVRARLPTSCFCSRATPR